MPQLYSTTPHYSHMLYTVQCTQYYTGMLSDATVQADLSKQPQHFEGHTPREWKENKSLRPGHAQTQVCKFLAIFLQSELERD